MVFESLKRLQNIMGDLDLERGFASRSTSVTAKISYSFFSLSSSPRFRSEYWFANNTNNNFEALFGSYNPKIKVYDNSNIRCLIVDSAKTVTSTIATIELGDIIRIYNASARIDLEIYLVGSRANGTFSPDSDWDYVIEGINNRKWKKIKNSLPGAKDKNNPKRNIDIIRTPIDKSRPYMYFSPTTNINDLKQ